MALPITALYAGLIALLFLVLSVRVIRARRTKKVSLGDADDRELQSRVRAHANCAEYAPLSLILLGLCEGLGTPALVLHLLGLTMLGGRFLHGVALNQARMNFRFRVWGMYLTFAMIGVAALGLIGHALI
ncbi:MAPEG family protein [Pseudaestuariivita sp.]|uniref:MAPEG family protein n=1 Tax=Pseudaestuariivita sp. TaxID=2211669 RepID=UPI004059FCF9